ncbi:C39 family peptidase [Oscillibacter sp.]|uniref:C39 family peptidase n=1 Tax=Oscillibacter sp. TaxID=1945593 RepID=UPI0026131355|nr:C39 family peptidase [Oscillibacter sp.]MDD3347060.1 papain-like cysteine protease family protein [Oscillibacter sp.]
MKKTVTLALTASLVIGLLSGCANDTPAQNAESPQKAENFSDEMKIPYATDLSPEDGADSVERAGDHENSPYFAHPDVYHLESTDTLTVLSRFKTQQQTSEWACGVTAALMVLEWYGKLGDWSEESLAALRHSLSATDLADYPGTTLNQAMDIFDGVGGFDMISTHDRPDGIWMEDIQGWLAEGKPVMICWNDWGGHWQVIVGYDTMGTETEQDDVFLVADPYDTTDHNQDGYGVYSAERLLYNFSMYGAFPEEEGGNEALFLVASPTE